MKNTLTFLLFFCCLSANLNAQTVTIETFSTGYSWLTGFERAPGDDRLYVFQKSGQIRLCNADGSLVSQPFLDIGGQVLNDGERGLVGLAFHPDYQSNGYFFVFYNRASDGACTIARWKRSDVDPDVADPISEGILLTFAHPAANHVGGCMKFGPDGYLYIATGDGGGGGDPMGSGQNLLSFLGKILRIDVNGGGYTVPADNPFVSNPVAAPEIWAYGLRNPWRISFDRWRGDLWIADVGQDEREEVDFQPADSPGGENYGWSCREGTLDFNPNQCFAGSVYTDPIFEYGHLDVPLNGWCAGSISGGVVYRGYQYDDLFGKYLFTDHCTGQVWALLQTPNAVEVQEIGDFGDVDFTILEENNLGELFITGINTNKIYAVKSTDCTPVAWIPTAETVQLEGGTFTLPVYSHAGGSGFSYQWMLNGNAISNATGTNLTVTEPGTYTVVVTNLANGCSNTSNAVAVQQPSITTVSGQGEACVATSHFYSTESMAGATYAWTATDGDIIDGQGTSEAQILWGNPGVGHAEVTVTLPGGSELYGELWVEILENNLSLSAEFSEGLCIGANNGFIDLTVSGSGSQFDYFWNTNETTQDIFNLPAGAYKVTVTNELGCFASGGYLLFEVSEPVIDLTVQPVTCAGPGSISGTASSPMCGTWPISLPDILAGGTYAITVTDCFGCDYLEQVAVEENIDLVLLNVLALVNPTFGEIDGSIEIEAANGTPPYSYLWSNGDMDSLLQDVPAGNYSVTVTDANGCEVTTILQLSEVNASTESSLLENLLLFPNPASEEVTLDLLLRQPQSLSVAVFDALGQQVKSGFAERPTAEEHRLQWDVSDWPSGIYFFEMKIGEAFFYRKVLRR